MELTAIDDATRASVADANEHEYAMSPSPTNGFDPGYPLSPGVELVGDHLPWYYVGQYSVRDANGFYRDYQLILHQTNLTFARPGPEDKRFYSGLDCKPNGVKIPLVHGVRSDGHAAAMWCQNERFCFIGGCRFMHGPTLEGLLAELRDRWKPDYKLSVGSYESATRESRSRRQALNAETVRLFEEMSVRLSALLTA